MREGDSRISAVGERAATQEQIRSSVQSPWTYGSGSERDCLPYRDPRTRGVLRHRVRLDTPVADGQKYLSEQGCRALYCPPLCGDVLRDVSLPVVLVEAEKSS